MMAQRIDLCRLQEMVMASALPIVMPARAASRVLDMTTVEVKGRDPPETGPL